MSQGQSFSDYFVSSNICLVHSHVESRNMSAAQNEGLLYKKGILMLNIMESLNSLRTNSYLCQTNAKRGSTEIKLVLVGR